MVLMDLLINWMGFIDGNNGDQPIYLLYLKYPNMRHWTGALQPKEMSHPSKSRHVTKHWWHWFSINWFVQEMWYLIYQEVFLNHPPKLGCFKCSSKIGWNFTPFCPSTPCLPGCKRPSLAGLPRCSPQTSRAHRSAIGCGKGSDSCFKSETHWGHASPMNGSARFSIEKSVVSDPL